MNCHIISEVLNLLPLQNKYKIPLLIPLVKVTKPCFTKPNMNPIDYLTGPEPHLWLRSRTVGTKVRGNCIDWEQQLESLASWAVQVLQLVWLFLIVKLSCHIGYSTLTQVNLSMWEQSDVCIIGRITFTLCQALLIFFQLAGNMQATFGQVHPVSNPWWEGRGCVVLEERAGALSQESGDMISSFTPNRRLLSGCLCFLFSNMEVIIVSTL